MTESREMKVDAVTGAELGPVPRGVHRMRIVEFTEPKASERTGTPYFLVKLHHKGSEGNVFVGIAGVGIAGREQVVHMVYLAREFFVGKYVDVAIDHVEFDGVMRAQAKTDWGSLSGSPDLVEKNST